MSKYKIGDRIWWHGSKMIVTGDNGGHYVVVDSGYYKGVISRRFIKPIITLKAQLS